MENKNSNNNVENQTKIEEFRNSELVVPFVDGNLLMKIAGENKWYVVNEKGDVVVRTRPDGTSEFSEVNFELPNGEPIDVEFGDFVGGSVRGVFTLKDGDKTIKEYVAISPSGYTVRFGEKLAKEPATNGLNYRDKYDDEVGLTRYPRTFVNFKVKYIDSLDEVDYLFDIAQYHLIKQYEEFCKNRQHILDNGIKTTDMEEFEYRRTLRSFGVSAKNIRQRYDDLQVLIPRQNERREESARRKQEKIETSRKNVSALKAETQEAMNALFQSNQK